MARLSLRDRLLETGVALLHEKGYAASGVREITQAAGAPLGSFTNHFRSKEEFAALVLDQYMSALLAVVERTLRDASREPLDRISAYFRAIQDVAEPLEWRFGCMVANMGLEMPSSSELIRARLAKALDALTAPFTDAIRAAQEAGRTRTDITPEDLAMIVLAAWHGVLIRAKVERCGRAPSAMARLLPVLLRTD